MGVHLTGVVWDAYFGNAYEDVMTVAATAKRRRKQATQLTKKKRASRTEKSRDIVAALKRKK